MPLHNPPRKMSNSGFNSKPAFGLGLSFVGLEQQVEDVLSACGDRRSGPKHTHHPMVVKGLVVPWRNDPTCHHKNVRPSSLAQGLDQPWHERQVSRGERADADHEDVVLNGLARHLCGRAEQRTEVHVKTKVSEGRATTGAPVVAVLPRLATNAGTAPGADANASLRARALS